MIVTYVKLSGRSTRGNLFLMNSICRVLSYIEKTRSFAIQILNMDWRLSATVTNHIRVKIRGLRAAE